MPMNMKSPSLDVLEIQLFLRNYSGLCLDDEEDLDILAQHLMDFIGELYERLQRTEAEAFYEDVLNADQEALLTNEQREQLLENGRAQRDAEKRGESIDFYPVVKLFTPEAQAIWLLTELHHRDPDVAFGLCDLGVGSPELGSVCVSELMHIPGPWGLPPVERDQRFKATKTLSAYSKEAHKHGRVVV